MVLTYTMVINRLDEIKEREKNVRNFYKPLSTQSKKKSWSNRHRYADVLEPGDVVKTIDKGTGEWREAMLGNNMENNMENNVQEQSHDVRASTAGTERLQTVNRNVAERESLLSAGRLVGPSRQSQEMVSYTAGKERQLREAIDSEFQQRREKLKQRLYREAGLLKVEDEAGDMEPLFKSTRADDASARRTPLSSTGSANPREIEVHAAGGMRWTGGPVFDHFPSRHGRSADGDYDVESLEVEEEELESDEDNVAELKDFMHKPQRRMSTTQPHRNSLHDLENQEVNVNLEQTARFNVADSLQNPENAEFYFLQMRLPDGDEIDIRGTFIVEIVGSSLSSKPEYEFPFALECNEGRKILFPRSVAGEIRFTTVLSPCDVLPWITAPRQLLGHSLDVSVYRDLGSSRKGSLLMRRTVNYRPSSSLHGGDAQGEVPRSAPAHHVSKQLHLGPTEPHNAEQERPSTVATSPSQGTLETGSPSKNRQLSELSREKLSSNVSPATQKRMELASIRQQMRASLQQTQSTLLASIKG
mmetsp:Transcript_50828/g.158838  ORF Transcript_50828/g.158838 Transcript_50828/m.158838 type:complete len:530 (+) Transcript_50828:380-1969(+)